MATHTLQAPPVTIQSLTLTTTYGIKIIGKKACYLVMGPHDQLLSCESTYAAACDTVSRLSMMHLRWVHSAKFYEIRMKNWLAGKRSRPTPKNFIYGDDQ